MNISTALKCLIVFLVVFSVNAFSQGVIRGVIKDAITGDRLVGANVHLAGTSLGASTNIEGEYKISLIPAGKYKAKISYIGYKSIDKEITVSSGQTVTWDAELKMDMVEGSEILVTGQAMGQASAINQQKNSNTIVNVLSEEKIQSLPDANAAEAIGRLPGVSIQRSGGEANKITLRGMSDKFSFVTIDGIRMAPTDADSRGIDLSTISQGSLAGIELYKALTPDKDADAIAGSVNLVTRKAPDERLLRVDAKGAYNKLKNTANQYDFQLRYGERFLNNILGVQLTGNLEKRDRSNEKYKLRYDTQRNSLGTEPSHEIADFELIHTKETRERQGLSLLLDINTPDDGSIRINNVFNGTSRNYATYDRHYPTNGQQLSNAGGVPYSIRQQDQVINTFNSSIRGNNNLFDLNVNWGASFAQSLGKFPFDFEMDFSEPTNIVNGVYTSGFQPIPQSVIVGNHPEQIIPYFVNSFDQALSSYGYYRQQRNLDKERTGFLDVSGKYSFGDMLTGEAKAGAKYRYKNRSKLSEEYDSQDYLYPLSTFYSGMTSIQSVGSNGAALFNVPAFAGTRFAQLVINASKPTVTNFMNFPYESRNIFDSYNLYPMIDPDAIREWYRITQNNCAPEYTVGKKSGMYQKNWGAVADYYDILERTSSAYVMNTLNYGQLVTFIAGVRVEREQNNYQSIWVKDPVSGFSANPNWAYILASHTETVYCPNFNLTMRPTDFMNVRLAAYKALARPDYNMRLNRYFYSASVTPRTLDAGNPNLVAAQAWNYEANTSFFDNSFGLITLSAFYKNIEHMYHKINGASTSGTAFIKTLGADWPVPSSTDEFALTMPYNSNKPTKVWGFEFEHQARFEFLPGYLKNIVLSYNCSLVKSESFVFKTKKDSLTQTDTTWFHGKPTVVTVYKPYYTFFEYKTKLEGQPEFYGNVSLGYDIAGLSVRLSYFYQSRYTTSYSIDGFNDSLQVAYGRMDLALKYEYDKHISVFLNINNLTDAEEKTIRRNRVDGWEVTTSSERYGLTGDVGIRYTF